MIKKILLGFLVFLFVGIGVGGTIFHFYRAHEPMFTPTGLNDHFPNLKPGTKFDEYIKLTQDMIRKARVQTKTVNADPKREEEIIELRAPFEVRPEKLFPDQKGKTHKYRNGVLIAHGLNRTPREMRSVADFFAKLGFLVRVTILPGHGTIVGDLGRVQAEDWLKMHTFGMESFKGEVDNLYLMGFSTGGLLTCVQALDHKKMEENNVRGLILMSPALEIKLPASLEIKLPASILDVLFKPMDMIPMLSFPVRVPEIDDYGYSSVSLNAGYQIYRAIKLLKAGRKRSEINLPIFTATTMEDLIVDVPAVKDYLYALPNPNNQHVIYTAEKITLPKVHGVAEQINSSQSAWGGRVIGFSHSAMHVGPEDEHYGRFTTFRPCGHYDEKSTMFKRCLEGNMDLSDKMRTCGRYHSEPVKLKHCKDTMAFVGETSDENLALANKKNIPLEALMYNNKFKYMFRVLDRFLFKTGAIDTRRYQLREYSRVNDIISGYDSIQDKLKNFYNNSDLSSALEDVSVDLDLNSVDYLQLKKTNISDISALSQLLELTHLFFEENGDWDKGVGIDDISALGSLKKLDMLGFASSPIKDITPLKNLKNISNIILEDTIYITKAQVDDLRKALPNTKIVHTNRLGISADPAEKLVGDFKGDMEAYFVDYLKNNPAAVKAITILFVQDLDLKSSKGLEVLDSLEDIRFNNTSMPDASFFEPLKSKDLKQIYFIDMKPEDAEKFQALVKVLEKDFPNATIRVKFNTLLKERLGKNGGDLVDALKDISKGYNFAKYLSILDIKGTLLSDLTPIAEFVNLEDLFIDGTQVSDLSPLTKLEKLQNFLANKSKITNLKGLDNKKDLQRVEFNETGVSDLSPLQGCIKLNNIVANKTPIASLVPMTGLPLLASLHVKETKIQDLKGLEGAKKLKTIVATSTQVSDLTPLKDLSLTLGSFDLTQVDDIGVLINSKNRGLTFTGTPFGDAAVEMGETMETPKTEVEAAPAAKIEEPETKADEPQVKELAASQIN